MRKVEDIPGRNEFLARNVNSLELNGKYSIYDVSKESLEVNKLARWYKVTPHEESCYRKLELILKDNNDEEYDSLTFEKAFMVDYSEDFNFERSTIDFYALIREFKEEILKVDGKNVGIDRIEKKTEIYEGDNVLDTSSIPFSAEIYDEEIEFVTPNLLSRLLGFTPDVSQSKKIYLKFYSDNNKTPDYSFELSEAKEVNRSKGKYSIEELVNKGYKKESEETSWGGFSKTVIYRKNTLAVPNNTSYITEKESKTISYNNLTNEQKMFISVLFAEMGSERIVNASGKITDQPNTIAWKAVAHIIMNRLNRPMDSWINAKNVSDIITDPGAFSGYKDNNYNYTMNYLNNRDFKNETIELLINETLPIYLGKDTNDMTKGAVLYYSPESMGGNSIPPWDFSKLIEININGVPKTSLRVFDYKKK